MVCKLPMSGVASAGAAMSDRTREPQRWSEVPKVAYDPTARLQAMDVDGVDASVLYPTVAGVAGKRLDGSPTQNSNSPVSRRITIGSSRSGRTRAHALSPNALCPSSPIEATVQEIQRAVKKGHKGVIFPAIPMHLRDVPHVNEPVYDPLWATCQDLAVPVCFHAGSSTRVQFPAYKDLSPGLAAGALGPDAPGE